MYHGSLYNIYLRGKLQIFRSLKKKARIYQLTQTDGVVSEYIGLYLDDNPERRSVRAIDEPLQ